MNAIFKLLSSDSPVIVDGRLLHVGRTGIGRITKLMIDTASATKTIFVLGAVDELHFENVIYINTNCNAFGFTFIFQNLLLNLLFFKKRIKIIFPHYFSAFCFIRKFVFVHDLMAITNYKQFYLRFALLKKTALKAIVGLGLVNADIACPSIYSCNMVESLFGVLPIYLPNGTNLNANKYLLPDFKSEVHVNLLSRPIIVGYIGNRRPHKNLPGLQRFCVINNFKLLLFDEFEPDVDHNDALLEKFYTQIHAVALLSHCEGFGIPIIEGALFGKYIFCSKIPPFLELLDIGLNLVDSDTLVTSIVRSNPCVVDKLFRFQKMKLYINSYVL